MIHLDTNLLIYLADREAAVHECGHCPAKLTGR